MDWDEETRRFNTETPDTPHLKILEKALVKIKENQEI